MRHSPFQWYDGIKLILPPIHRRLIFEHVAQHPSIESGLTLFGYNRAPIFEVTHAICGENVSRGRHYYVNDALNEQRYLDLIRQSESAIQFLGTVHSHPDHGYPSGQDVASARLALQRCAFLFVVIATNYTHWSEFTLRAFFLTRGMNTLVEVGMSDGGEQNERCQPTDAIVM